MFLERAFFNKYMKSGSTGRAIATFIYLKNSFRNGSICNFTYAKMSQITGWSAPTCRKQMQVLKSLGLVRLEAAKSGDGKVNLRLLRRCDPVWQRNICLHQISQYKYCRRSRTHRGYAKDLYYLILGFAVTECQLRKEEVRHLIATRRSPSDLKEFLKAKKKLEKIGACGQSDFCDGGTSYKYIQSNLECSPYLVAKVVKKCDGVIFAKEKHKIMLDKDKFPVCNFDEIVMAFEAEHMPGKLYRTRYNIYHNLANTYTILTEKN